MARLSLEQQIFSWDQWQDEGPGLTGFSDVELKVAVGQFPAGTKFPFAWFEMERAAVTLIDENEEGHTFALNITVGEELPSADACDCGHDHYDHSDHN